LLVTGDGMFDVQRRHTEMLGRDLVAAPSQLVGT
jgi:hypothetical protein